MVEGSVDDEKGKCERGRGHARRSEEGVEGRADEAGRVRGPQRSSRGRQETVSGVEGAKNKRLMRQKRSGLSWKRASCMRRHGEQRGKNRKEKEQLVRTESAEQMLD